ncbi:helix-turn-helix domain-containing protein [Limisphaera sp. VF-2]|uniref:helix-turn-helix domain-containing protein n=1 Tax=Limisphaera sp. VF-2 TaxID=3400418 RepID=UPI001777320E
MKQFDVNRPEFLPYGFTCELWRPARMPRPDKHSEVELNWLKAGSLTYLLGGRRITVPARRLAVFWAAIPHQIVAFEGHSPYYVVTVPLGEFLGMGLPPSFTHPLLEGSLLLEPRPDPADRFRFPQWEQELRLGDPARERPVRLEIQARLLRLALDVARAPAAPCPEPALSRADQLACYIARHYQQPLTASRIAAAHGLHPNYAMNLFRRAFGTTLIAFLTRHRLCHAQRLLVTTDEPILQIALASGFQSLSRFNEVFKKVCGCSPREYRKAHRTPASNLRRAPAGVRRPSTRPASPRRRSS